jgi:hypothetical protein
MRIFRPVRVLMTLDPGLGEAYSQTDRPSNIVGYGPFYGGKSAGRAAIHESDVKMLTIYSARWPVGVLLCYSKAVAAQTCASILLLSFFSSHLALQPPQPSPLSLHSTNLRQCLS